MTDRNTIVWAPGGGLGHLRRALNIAESMPAVTIFHHAAQIPWSVGPHVTLRRLPQTRDLARLRELLRAQPAGHDFVADTFPAGLFGEITPEVLAHFGRSTLVARWVDRDRYSAVGDYENATARFDDVLLPYPADQCEWEGSLAGRHVGHIVRPLHVSDDRCSVAVVGAQLPTAFAAMLPEDATWIGGPFDSVPRADRYVGCGAGYNLSFELSTLPHVAQRLRLVPLEKRYDNQFQRAMRLGALAATPSDLRDFLEAG